MNFNIAEVRIEGRNHLELPTRGRLNQEQQYALDTYCKQRYIEHLVENDVVDKTIGKIAFQASFPTTEKGYVEKSVALDKYKIHPNKFSAAGGDLLISLLNFEFHNGVQAYEYEDETVAASPAPGRRKGTKNRDKDVVAHEKAMKAIRSEGRASLGLPARGRLTEEQNAELEKYVNEHAPEKTSV